MPGDSPHHSRPGSPPGHAAFKAALERHGIDLAPDEAGEVENLAGWLSAGVGRLAAVASAPRPPGASAADAAPDLTIAEAGRRLRDGRLTSVALTRAHLERIADGNPTLRAFYTVLARRALDDARRADAELATGTDRGPLHGIPVAIKDLIDVAGAATTAGSKARRNASAETNAEAVQRLVDGGAVILGKLATYEWGTVGPAFDTLFPPALNPWRLDHITGGSSSGCAAAVAGRLVRTSVGSDTGGSLRSPAAYCGVVGLKPTYGAVPGAGAIGLAPSMDHLGPISATVGDAALTCDVIAGRTGPQAAAGRLGQSVAGLRVAYARNWFARDPRVLPAIVAAMDEAVSQFSLLGAVIEPVDLPDYDLFEAAGAAILHAEAFRLHAADLRDHPEAYGRKSFQTLAAGISLTDADYRTALRAGAALRMRIDAALDRVDALVTVCTLTTALPVSAFGKTAAWTPMRTIGFNVTGHPVLALPIGVSDTGLPMGMQIVGRHFEEAVICQLGDAYECVAGLAGRTPPHAAHVPTPLTS
jgi:Asp-tRNA(Asn)/Glu-tRNA(Gln) amidotransferase A subunit family amidase